MIPDLDSKQLRVDLRRSIEKILIYHRYTKLFLFLMSGPFLIFLLGFKYNLKVLIVYFLYKYIFKFIIIRKS